MAHHVANHRVKSHDITVKIGRDGADELHRPSPQGWLRHLGRHPGADPDPGRGCSAHRPAEGCGMPQGWGDSQPCTDFARIDVSDAQVGTEKRALRSNQETDEGKLRRPGQLLDKENPIQGPWCRFRREARARERHRHCDGG